MGKAQFQRKTEKERRRHNPVRVPDAHLPHGQIAVKGKEEAMLPVLKKLSDSDENERAWACAAVTNLIQNDPATRRLFQGKNVVGALVERLGDGSDGVVVEASGALRNLAIDAGGEVVGEMYNKGVLGAIRGLVARITSTIKTLIAAADAPAPPATPGTTAISPQVIFPLTENILTLLWCLAETSDKILNALNNAELVPFLTAFLVHRESLPLPVVAAACQCLYALSLDNKPFKTAMLSDPTATSALIGTLSTSEEDLAKAEPENKGKKAEMQTDAVDDKAARRREEAVARAVLIKVLAAGIIRNITPVRRPLVDNLDSAYIMPLIQPLLDVDLQRVAQEVLETVPLLPDVSKMSAAALAKRAQSDHRTPAEIKLESIEKRLSTLMIALEVLTESCAGLIDEVPEEQELGEPLQDDDSDAGSLDEDMEEDADETMDERLIAQGRDQTEADEVADLGPQVKPTVTPLETLASSGLHIRLMALARATSLSFPPDAATPSPHPPTTAVLSAIHLRALEALNNLLLTMAGYAPPASPPLASPTDIDPRQQTRITEWRNLLDGPLSGLRQIWMDTFDIAREVVQPDVSVLDAKGQEIRLEILEMLAGVWLGLGKIGGAGGLPISDDQIQGVIQAYMVVRSDAAKARVITAVGALAMRQDVTVEQNQACGSFLMSIVSSVTAGPGKQVGMESVVAGLNAMFDVYGDERSSYDQQVFVQGGYLHSLALLVHRMRSLAKGIDKRKRPELRVAAEEAYENLAAFIKYRRSVA